MTLWTVKVYNDHGFLMRQETSPSRKFAMKIGKWESEVGFASVNKGLNFLWYKGKSLLRKTT